MIKTDKWSDALRPIFAKAAFIEGKQLGLIPDHVTFEVWVKQFEHYGEDE